MNTKDTISLIEKEVEQINRAASRRKYTKKERERLEVLKAEHKRLTTTV
jgi:hypothetical protein